MIFLRFFGRKREKIRKLYENSTYCGRLKICILHLPKKKIPRKLVRQ